LTHHKRLDLSKQIFLFEKLSDIKNQRISFKIIETTFVSKMFIKLERLSILRGLFSGVRLVYIQPKKRDYNISILVPVKSLKNNLLWAIKDAHHKN
jgi:hypothetical protein